MTKRVSSKYKIDRRLGVNLWGREKSPYAKKNYGPGQHGMQRSRPTDYGIQLKAKQKLKNYYGEITEKQFKNILKKALKTRGDTSQNLISLLERRLDAIVYRLKFAPTIFAARQLVNHGHVNVNGKRLDIPSARLNEGDEIQISLKLKDNPVVLSAIESKERDVPGYFEVEPKDLKGKFMKIPAFEDVPYPVEMEPHLVIEFYSR